MRIERKQWFRPHLCAMSQDAPRQFDVCTGPDMPQNQRRASGLAMVIAAMSSSSPGRIGVSMATTSRPAGSRMKLLEARPTQVACV